MKPSRPLALLTIALLYACANLPDVAADTCGNRVIEANEDCDTFDVGSAKCGAKGTPTACRLLCTSTAECPAGWGCGTDGICRAPSGQFDTTFVPVPSGQARLQVGDFDGDGRKDLLASSVQDPGRPEIHFVGDSGQIVQTLLVGASVRAPMVTRALTDDDGLDDIVFASAGGGVDMLLGQSDRTVVPVAYPATFGKTDVAFFGLAGSFVDGSLPVTSGAAAPVVTHGLAVVVGSSNGKPLFAGSDLSGLPIPLNIPPDVALGGRGDILDGRVTKLLPGSVCGDLVILSATNAGKGAPELDIIPVCRKEVTGKVVFNDVSPATALAPTRVDLVKLAALKLQPVSLAVGDMDADGQKDVIINFAAQTGATQHAPFVYNVKTGTLTELVYTLKGNTMPLARGNPIIAAEDLNGDGLTDVVFSDQVALSTVKPGLTSEFVTVARNTGDPWTQAIAADMNADGFKDVAAITPSRTLVDFFVGTPGGLFSPGTLSTGGSVGRIEVGDYDGDNVTDLGILVRASADSSGGDILVAYGRKQGLPEAPKLVASFLLANDLTTLPSVIDVLTIVGNDPTGPTTAAAGLVGDADRFPLAVKSVADATQANIGSALAVYAGALTAKGQTDVGALYGDVSTARSSGVGLAIAPQGSDFQGDLGAFTSEIAPAKDPQKAILLGTDSADAKMNRYLASSSVPLAITDVDHDGIDDVYVVSGTVGGKTATIAKLSAAGRVDLAAAPAPFGVAGKLSFVDADGDGFQDLVYISGFTSVTPGRSPREQTKIAGSSSMTIFFNDGKGAISPSGVAVSNIAVGAVQNATDGGGAAGCETFADPTAIVNVRADARGASKVAVLTAKCLYVGTLDRSGGGKLSSLLDRTLSVGFSLTVGDLSGDGVDELAFLDDRSLTILKQRPVLP